MENNNVTWGLNAEITNREKESIARQRPENRFSRQLKQASESKLTWPSLVSSPINESFNDGDILGSGVFYTVRAWSI